MKCNQCGNEVKEEAKFCNKCGNSMIENLRTDKVNEEWFCLVMEGNNYQKMGPFALMELKVLLKDGKIDRQTSVWKEGFEEWVELSKTELFQQLKLNEVAPPVDKGNVSNGWVWVLAFAPLISMLIYQVIAREYLLTKIQDGSLYTELNSVKSTLQSLNIAIALGLNIFLTWKDQSNLKKLGHDTKQLGSCWLIPTYLFKRAKYLKQSNAYAIVWIVTFVILLFS